MIKVLFVCTANVCRSPAAEAILNGLIKQNHLEDEVVCSSAGTLTSHENDERDLQMMHICKSKGYQSLGRPRAFAQEDFFLNDLIIPLDSENLKAVLKLAPLENVKEKVCHIREFNCLYEADEILDPSGGTEEQYLDTFEIIHDACLGLLERLQLIEPRI